MSWRDDDWERDWGSLIGRQLRSCVPHCDRLESFDCQHQRLRYSRFGFWQNGKWVCGSWVFGGAWDGDIPSPSVDASWAKPEGRDADIRRRYEAGETQKRIAALYNLDQATVSRITSGDSTRPRGRYSTRRHVKRATQRELDRIAESLCYVLDWKERSVYRRVLYPWEVNSLCAVSLINREESMTDAATTDVNISTRKVVRPMMIHTQRSSFTVYPFDCQPNGHVETWWCARNHRATFYSPTLKGLAVKIQTFRKVERKALDKSKR